MTARWEDRGRMLLLAADSRRLADRFDQLVPERSRNPYTGEWERRPGLTAVVRDHADWLEARVAALGDEDFGSGDVRGDDAS